jgi:ABC-type branched-subunit amino acid transport system substrate-binding protein
LSGGLEQWCQPIREGIELAASESSDVNVTPVFEDDRSADKASALSAVQKMIQVDNIDVLYSWTPSLLPVLEPLTAKAKLPYIVGAYDRRVGSGGPNVLSAFVNYDLVARDIASFFVEKRRALRIGMVLASDAWSEGFREPFQEEVIRLGGTIVFDEPIAPDEKDTRTIVLRMKRAHVDAVLAPLYGGALLAFLGDARRLGFSGLINVADGMFEEDILVAKGAAEGVYATQLWLESEQLSAKVTDRFGGRRDALQLGLVATGYDLVTHLRAAVGDIVSRGETPTRETIGKTLKNFASTGLLGPQMYGAPPAVAGDRLVVVRGGRYTLVN